MNSYELGKQDRANGVRCNPYRVLMFGLTPEQRKQRSIDGDRWEAGWTGHEDPHSSVGSSQ